MYSRRQILKLLARIGLASPVMISLPATARAGIDDWSKEERLAVFLDLSRFLTGFDDLNTELGHHYLKHVKSKHGEALLHSILTLFDTNKNDVDNLKMQLGSNPRLRETGKTITRLWYSGWLTKTDEIPTEVLALSYTHSLAWRSMGLMPRGVPTGQLWSKTAR